VKKITRFLSALFGVFALSAMIVGTFIACGGDNSPPHNNPVVPQEYQNTSWEHTDGYTLTLGKDKVTITLTDGTTVSYPYTETRPYNEETHLYFETSSKTTGTITIIDGRIIRVFFPNVDNSGGWWKISDIYNTVYTFTSIDDMKTWLDTQLYNYPQIPYHIKLNVDDITGLQEVLETDREGLNLNGKKYINLDLSDSTITTIPDKSFYYCRNLTSVTIPFGITSIGNNAFGGCTNLVNIILPNSVTSIGSYAFAYCENITSINIPTGVTSIEVQTFCGCTSLTDITIPNSVKIIKMHAFASCTSLISITIPDGVTKIEGNAFANCTSLTSFNIPIGIGNNLGDIYEGTFRNCTSLVSITIPDRVSCIRDYAFAGCTSLVNVIIPNNAQIIGEGAFTNCTSLVSITIPDRVITIDRYLFAGCTNLTSVTFQSDNIINFSTPYYSTAFDGDLYNKYNAGGAGTYTRTAGGTTWIKTP